MILPGAKACMSRARIPLDTNILSRLAKGLQVGQVFPPAGGPFVQDELRPANEANWNVAVVTGTHPAAISGHETPSMDVRMSTLTGG